MVWVESMYIIALVMLIAVLVWSAVLGQSVGAILNFIDMPSLLIILMITVPMLLASGLFPDLRRAFRVIMVKKAAYTKLELQRSLEAVKLTIRLIFYSGFLGTIVGLITILKSLKDIDVLGPNLSVMLICILYAIFGSFLLLPIASKLRVEILAYDEKD